MASIKRQWSAHGANMPPWWKGDRYLTKLGEARALGDMQDRRVPEAVQSGPATDWGMNKLAEEFQ